MALLSLRVRADACAALHGAASSLMMRLAAAEKPNTEWKQGMASHPWSVKEIREAVELPAARSRLHAAQNAECSQRLDFHRCNQPIGR